MSARPVSRSRRPRLLFAALFALGMVYIVAFAWFLVASVDHVARGKDERAAAAAALQPLPAPARLAMTAGQPGGQLLGRGWHRPDSEGTWSDQPEAAIWLQPASEVATRLALAFTAHIDPARGELPVELLIGEVGLAAWRPTAAAPHVQATVDLPARRPGAGPIELRLRIDRPRSQRQLGVGPDGRPLGIHLRWLELQPQ